MATPTSMPKPSPVRPVPPPLNSPERQAASKEPMAAEPTRKPIAPWRLKVGKAIPWVLAVFIAGLAVQIYLAGYGLSEVGDQGMSYHIDFAHVVEVIPIIILIVGFLGADKMTGWGGVALLVMFQLQYVFLYATDSAVVRALHPTNGALMLVLSVALLLHHPMWAKAPASKTNGKA